MIYWHGNNPVIHLVRATHAPYQHTPYTCVYTPIYPVFYTAYPGTGRINPS
nr:MAG TPA: hypothetical protein [Podoviridae sp. ctfN46]DAL07933.1 MAG TPA: hypothetical protein [Bacteriophage sp.]